MTVARVPMAWWAYEAITDKTTWQLGVSAGLGSGKTHGVDQWFHDRVRKNHKCRFSAQLWPTFQKIADAGIPTYEKILNALGRSPGIDYKVVKSPYPKIVYLDQKTPHEVHFLSAENPERIVAVEYSHSSEHEAGIINKEASDNLRSRTRDPLAAIRQVMREGAPQGITNFANDFDSDTLDGWNRSTPRDHYFDSKLPKRRFTVWTDDNPVPIPGYVDILEDTYGHNANLIKAYRYGVFCPLAEGSAYACYFPQKHDIDDIAPEPYREIVITFDFNANPMTWTVVQKVPYLFYDEWRFRYVAIDECSDGITQISDSCVDFATKFPPAIFGGTKIRVFGDRSGHAKSPRLEGSSYEDIERYLKKLGYLHVEVEAAREVAPEAESVEAVNRLFLQNALVLCKRVRLLRRSLVSTNWKKGIRKLDKPAGETHTHPSDGLKYWAWQETREETGANTKKIHGFNR